MPIYQLTRWRVCCDNCGAHDNVGVAGSDPPTPSDLTPYGFHYVLHHDGSRNEPETTVLCSACKRKYLEG